MGIGDVVQRCSGSGAYDEKKDAGHVGGGDMGSQYGIENDGKTMTKIMTMMRMTILVDGDLMNWIYPI